MKICNLNKNAQSGYTLLELIVTLTVLAVLVMGTIPLTQNAVKRQKEIRLRQTLRQLRNAIDEFKRDSYGACPQGSISNETAGRAGSTAIPTDPRSRVVIDDCKIFDTENLDRFPPTLDILAEGVRVKARGLPSQAIGGRGIGGDDKNATELGEQKEVIKYYLREIPDDPMTPEKEDSGSWILRSSYQDKDSNNWDEVNVFDVRSSSDATALNGEKYSDW